MFKRLRMFALCFVVLATGFLPIQATSFAQESTPAATVPEGDQLFAAEGVSSPILATAPIADPSVTGGTLVLARIELQPGSDLPAQIATGPEILYVESGDLTIQDDFGFGTSIAAGSDLVLNPGTGYTLANSGSAPVQALRLSVMSAPEGGTPSAAPVDLTGATTLLSIPIDALPEAGGTIYMAQVTFQPGAVSGQQAHSGSLGVYIVDGVLKMTSPSGLEGDMEAGRNVVLPAATPLQARSDTGATAIIVGVGESSANLMSEVTQEPTAEPTPDPTAEATPESEPASEPTAEVQQSTPENVLFQDGGDTPFGTWATGNGWMPVDNMIVSDGETCGYAVAPIDLSGVRDYAIEVETQLVAFPREGSTFGVFGRWNGQTRYVAGIGREQTYHDDGQVIISYATQEDELNSSDYFRVLYRNYMAVSNRSLDSDWHTYRFEMRGNEQRLYIDGAEVARSTDNRIVTGGDAGLWCNRAQVSVRSFRIVPLGDAAATTNTTANAVTTQAAVPATASTTQAAAPAESGNAQTQAAGGVYSGDLTALLPSQADVPAHLVITGGERRTLDQVAANYAHPADTVSLFQQWGWQGNVTRAFNMPSGVAQPPGEVEGIYVSIHAFSNPESARAALDWSLQEQMLGTSLYEISVAPMGDYARALYGPVSYGTEITFLVQKDNLLLRLSASSRDGDPSHTGTLAMNAVLSKLG